MKVEQIFISPGHNFFGHYGKPPGEHPIQAMKKVECVAGSGIRHDRFFDYKPDYHGQITFFSAEIFDDLCQHFGLSDVSPALLRRNVIVRGADLDGLIEQKFRIQEIEFLGTGEAKPCFWMNQALCEGAEEWLRGRGGLRAKILTTGILGLD